MKLLYYCACIGAPEIERKQDILVHNLNYLHNQLGNTIDVVLNCYDNNEPLLVDKTKGLGSVGNVFSYQKKGVLTELFLTNPHNDKFANYDAIIFNLDDVKIINMNISHMMEVKKKYNIAALSPKITGSTHPWMHSHNHLTMTNALEVYFLLLTPDDIVKFFSMHTIENRWMWGADFMFGYHKVSAGVIGKYVADHVLPSRSDKDEAGSQGDKYLRNHGFRNLDHVKKSYQPIQKHIHDAYE